LIPLVELRGFELTYPYTIVILKLKGIGVLCSSLRDVCSVMLTIGYYHSAFLLDESHHCTNIGMFDSGGLKEFYG